MDSTRNICASLVVGMCLWASAQGQEAGFRPPEWKDSWLRLPAAWVGGDSLQVDLAEKVKRNGKSTMFHLKQAPEWLKVERKTITKTTILTGVPKEKDAGVRSFEIEASNGVDVVPIGATLAVRKVDEFFPRFEIPLPKEEVNGLAIQELPKGQLLTEFAESVSKIWGHEIGFSPEAKEREGRITVEATEDCIGSDVVLAFMSSLDASGLKATAKGDRVEVEVRTDRWLKSSITFVRNEKREYRKLFANAKPSGFAWMVGYLENNFGPYGERMLLQYPTLVVTDTDSNIESFRKLVSERKKAVQRNSKPTLRFPRPAAQTDSPNPYEPPG